MVRTPACHAGGRGFESRSSRSSKWISDDVATDELIHVVGLDEINRSTPRHLAVNGLGLHAAAGLAAADRA